MQTLKDLAYQVNGSNASRMETPIKMAENLNENETGLRFLQVRRI